MTVSGLSSSSNIWSLLEQMGSSSSSTSTDTSNTSDFSMLLDMMTGSSSDTSQDSSASSSTMDPAIMTLFMALQQASGATGAQCGTSSGNGSNSVAAVGSTNSTSGAHHGHHHHMSSDIMSQVDSNGDGSISKSEMENFAQSNGGTTSQADSIFSALDTNSDNSVSTDEIASGLKRLMHTMQTNLVAQATATNVSFSA